MNSILGQSQQRIIDYFAVVGLNPTLKKFFKNEVTIPKSKHNNPNSEKPDFYPTIDVLDENKLDPIIDLLILDKTIGENVPQDYECLWSTPSGHSADLNHDSLRAHQLFLCFKRGKHIPPITDIGVLYENNETVMEGCTVIRNTISGASANVNNSSLTGNRIFITYRRGTEIVNNSFAVINICVIIESKVCQFNLVDFKTINYIYT
jgi:hypothetical protein